LKRSLERHVASTDDTKEGGVAIAVDNVNIGAKLCDKDVCEAEGEFASKVPSKEVDHSAAGNVTGVDIGATLEKESHGLE
jgi:hypothetical protein